MFKQFLILIFNFFDNLVYAILYYLFYKFSGAHNKPTSDSKYDPKIQHQNNIFYRLLRSYENRKLKFRLIKHTQSVSQSSTEENKLITTPLPSMTLTSDNKVNRELFLSNTNNKRQPIVIKGLARDSFACKTWSSSFFLDNYGDTKLLTLKRGDKFKTDNAYTSFTQKLDCDYVSLKENIENMLIKTTDTTNSVYINNVMEIFDKHPELVKHLELNNILKIDDSINEETWLKVQLFMGGPGTGSSLHCAVGGNFFFNIYGKKKWILIDPKYTMYLQSTPAEKFGFVISGYDIENVEQFGILNKLIPKYEVILEPGDVLFVPPWYWHYVHNETDFTIGCAVRDHTVYKQGFQNNPLFMLLSPYFNLKLSPLFLKTVEFIKGRNFLLRESAKSDKQIMKHLTGKLVDSTDSQDPIEK
jgi:hypothetical protein